MPSEAEVFGRVSSLIVNVTNGSRQRILSNNSHACLECSFNRTQCRDVISSAVTRNALVFAVWLSRPISRTGNVPPASLAWSGDMHKTSTQHESLVPLDSLQLIQLRKAILKQHWIGEEGEADRLLLDFTTLGPSEIFPIEPMETD
jgi:hypothetical protein